MTDARIDNQDDTWRLGVVAAAAFAVAAVLRPIAATLLAIVGVSLLIASVSGAQRLARAITPLRMTAVTIAVALAAIVVPQPLHGSPPWAVARGLHAIALVFALVCFASPILERRLRGVVAAVLVIFSIGAGSWLIQTTRGSGLDIVLLHESAAAALARGENPYGNAVTAPNGAPGVPAGSMIVGYPYPPIVAVMYSAGTWLTGEPRWVSLACWIVLLVSLLSRLHENPNRSLIPVLMLAAFPGWGVMLQSGWTEPLSAALLAVAAVLWRSPTSSGVALGCALGSKQYFIAMVPALLRWRDAGWQRRVATALMVAAVTVVPALIWSPMDDVWRSLVAFHTSTPLRPDSQNIVGALAAAGWSWAPPVWLALLLAAGAVAVVPFLRDRTACWRGAAIGLAVLFLFSRQAMPNYWYLVAVIALLGSISVERRSATLDPTQNRPGTTRQRTLA